MDDVPNGAGGVITFEQFHKNLKAAEVREYFQTLGPLAFHQLHLHDVSQRTQPRGILGAGDEQWKIPAGGT